MKKTKFYSIGLIVTALLLAACSSTKLLSAWKGDVPAGTTDKMIVFSLIGKNSDIQVQGSFENAIVAKLKANGVDAYSAYSVFGPSALKNMDKETLAKQIREKKFTGALLVVFLDKDQQETYVPPTTTTYAVPTGPVFYDPWFHPYFSCYNYYYDHVTTPGYWETTTTYILETRLFNCQDEKDAVYVATTATTDPSDIDEAEKEIASAVVKDMKDKGLFQK
ncbi:MAG: hypothetical protein MJ003_00955 [Paludibacteraceae bacterium]|nr:hypothetical protein [Paludibacteraceae bacterium]